MPKTIKTSTKTTKTTKSSITGKKSKKGSYYGYDPNSAGAKEIRKKIVKDWDEYNKAHAKKMKKI